MELLAPAGSLEAIKVAIYSGADAVYCSGIKYGARATNETLANLTEDEIVEAANFVHFHNKKIYITVNTLIMEDELEECLHYIDFLVKYVDAIIVQDYGILHYIRLNYPNMDVHVSTQANIHNVDDVKFLKNLGVKRIILARETPLSVIKEINKLGIEIEIFIHGALCFSHSGECYLSYNLGNNNLNKSGNRGNCAQPCRKEYQLMEDGQVIKTASLLSMKDLNTIDYLKDILDLDITSFKIEGRRKSLEYLYSVVRIYRMIIDNKDNKDFTIDEETLNKLYTSYSREFTKGYLFNEANFDLVTKNQVNHQGILIGKVINANNYQTTIKLLDTLTINDGIRIVNKNYQEGFIVTNMVEGKKIVKESCGIVTITSKYQFKVNDLVYKTYSYTLHQEVINLKDQYFREAKLKIIIKQDYQEVEFSSEDYIIKETANYHLESSNNSLNDERILKQFSKTNSMNIKYIAKTIENNDNLYLPIPFINQIRSNLLSKVKEELEQRKENKGVYYPFIDKYNEEELNIKDLKITNIKSKRIDYDNLSTKEYAYHLAEIGKNTIISPYFNVCNHLAISFFRNLTDNVIILGLESDEFNSQSIAQYDNRVGYLTNFTYSVMLSSTCIVPISKNIKQKHCHECEHHKYQLVDQYHKTFDLSFNDCIMEIKSENIKRKPIKGLVSINIC